jgi:hypothetical protein
MTLNVQTADDRSPMPVMSPLVLCDRLLTLAKDLDEAGFRDIAVHLLKLTDDVLQPAWPPQKRSPQPMTP